MSFWTLLFIAVGISADAFAVALGKGLSMRRLDMRAALAIAGTFGLFQGLMPLLGWGLGSQLHRYIMAFDHWVAFGLLALIGGTMLYQAVTDGAPPKDTPTVAWQELLALATATSIDAFAVGISFALLDVAVVTAVVLIGVTTLVISLAGVLVGHRAGVRYRSPAEFLGGLVLIGIGVRILLDHLNP